jgi:excisionase family DNA binding protein
MEKRLLSAKEAGQYLGISHRTVWAWAQQGLITCVRLRRRVLFDRVDLDKMIEDCTEGPEEEQDEE